MSLIVSIQLGRIQTYDRDSQPWTSATVKLPVTGPVWLDLEGFSGDQQADRRFHGGPEKAALVYSADHHALWQEEGVFAEPLPPGAFGENLLVSGMSEKDVCIGDIYRAGEAAVQVSQPRQPCRKQARRWRIPDLAARMVRNGRTGWYLRVLEPGHIQAGDHFELQQRPHPEWPIPRAHAVMHFQKNDAAATAALAACEALSEEWKRELLARL